MSWTSSIIDTAGFSNLTAAAAIGCSDHVLVPCMPDRGSTREAAKTMAKTASLAKAARRAIGASIVLSQWRTNGVAEQAALEDMADYGIKAILRTPVPDRAAFRRLTFDGKAVSGAVGAALDGLVRRASLASKASKAANVCKAEGEGIIWRG